MSFGYTRSKFRLATGAVNLATADVRAILVMTNTTADTEEDTEFIGDFTTLDEMDGANYVRIALANETVNLDTINNRAEFDADNITWTALGAGTRDVAALLIYIHVTNDTDSWPFVYIDDQFPFSANGGDLTINFNAEGIAQVT